MIYLGAQGIFNLAPSLYIHMSSYIYIYTVHAVIFCRARRSCESIGRPYVLNTRSKEKKDEILFIFSLFCEYIDLEYVCIHAKYGVNQADYIISIPVAAPRK